MHRGSQLATNSNPHLADALVAHAHAKHGEAAGAQLLDDLQADAAVLGPPCRGVVWWVSLRGARRQNADGGSRRLQRTRQRSQQQRVAQRKMQRRQQQEQQRQEQRRSHCNQAARQQQ